MPTWSQRDSSNFFWGKKIQFRFEAEVDKGAARLISLLLNWIFIHTYFWKLKITYLWYASFVSKNWDHQQDILTTFYAQYFFQEKSIVPRPILGKHFFSQCVIQHSLELRSHCDMVSTAVVSVEKHFKGLQKLCHFLLQPICALDTRVQFKEVSSQFSISVLCPNPYMFTR